MTVSSHFPKSLRFLRVDSRILEVKKEQFPEFICLGELVSFSHSLATYYPAEEKPTCNVPPLASSDPYP